MTRAWLLLAALTILALACDAAACSQDRPLIDRHSCLDEPSSHTLALDTSLQGDALYRFVYATLFALGPYPPRPGFPHLDLAPACTIGWKDGTAALRVGEKTLLVTFAGAHVASVGDG